MRVLMTGGGTAGHINPAIAIADKIKAEHPDAQFLFVGTLDRMETRLVPAAGYALKTVKVSGFSRSLSLKGLAHNVTAVTQALTASSACRKIIRDFKPDIAIGTGGYVCGPVLRQAAKMGVPVVVHEANALPGVTVKMLSKYAKAVLVCNEQAKSRLPETANVIVTGNPVKTDFGKIDYTTARKELGQDNRVMVLSFGGSLGAAKINEAVKTVLENAAKVGTIQCMHATGKGGYDAFCASLSEDVKNASNIRIREYIDDMPRCMAAADIVISRCGAMTLAELPIAGKPAILIPSPYVAENHQFYNAQVLVEAGAAICIEEKDLTGEALWEAILTYSSDGAKRQATAKASKTLAVTDAADRIYAVIQEILNIA